MMTIAIVNAALNDIQNHCEDQRDIIDQAPQA
jgi:hypothetical protein